MAGSFDNNYDYYYLIKDSQFILPAERLLDSEGLFSVVIVFTIGRVKVHMDFFFT